MLLTLGFACAADDAFALDGELAGTGPFFSTPYLRNMKAKAEWLAQAMWTEGRSPFFRKLAERLAAMLNEPLTMPARQDERFSLLDQAYASDIERVLGTREAAWLYMRFRNRYDRLGEGRVPDAAFFERVKEAANSEHEKLKGLKAGLSDLVS